MHDRTIGQLPPVARFPVLLLFAAMLASQPAPSSQSRYALVVGNAAYTRGPLTNTLNDARDISAKLRSFGFDVDVHINADQRTMEQAIGALTRRLIGDGKVGLFYFSGHGIEYQGRNYLIPIGAEINNEVDLKYEAVDAGRILDGMEMAGNSLNLVVLDACRNNPYRSTFRSASSGLTRLSPARGTLVLYATQPGAVASDGTGRNGTFTKHLLAAMDTQGLEVEQVFKRAAIAVDRETGGAQTPWVEGVVLGRFSFQSAIDSGSGEPDSGRNAIEPTRPPPEPVPVQLSVGHLQINVNTAAHIRLNGRSVGEAAPGRPLNLSNLPTGSYRVAVSAADHIDQELSVRVSRDNWTQEVVTLSPKHRPAPTPSPIYVPEPPPPIQTKKQTRWSSSYSVEYGNVSGPSFRCSGKLNPVERIICDDPDLARADGIMGALYRDARLSLSGPDANRVRKAQRQWIKGRDRACPTSTADLRSSSRFARVAQCLRDQTEQRSAELWGLLQSVAGR